MAVGATFARLTRSLSRARAVISSSSMVRECVVHVHQCVHTQTDRRTSTSVYDTIIHACIKGPCSVVSRTETSLPSVLIVPYYHFICICKCICIYICVYNIPAGPLPSAEVFFARYIRTGTPVIFRGAADINSTLVRTSACKSFSVDTPIGIDVGSCMSA